MDLNNLLMPLSLGDDEGHGIMPGTSRGLLVILQPHIKVGAPGLPWPRYIVQSSQSPLVSHLIAHLPIPRLGMGLGFLGHRNPGAPTLMCGCERTRIP